MRGTKRCSGFSDRTQTYLSNTSIHGMRYLTDGQSNLFERVFWFVICCLSFVGTYFLFVATWDTYVSNPISFVTETSYLDWNTTFPAVSVCESESSEKVKAFSEAMFGKNRNFNVDSFLNDILFNRICHYCPHCGTLIEECPENLQEIITQFRAPCEELLSSCSWNNEPFVCCSLFERLETEFGPCFTINSMQTERFSKEKKRRRKLPLISNRHLGPGTLKFRINEAAFINIHAPEDVPFFNRVPTEFWTLAWGKNFSASFQVTEIVNDPLLEEVEVEHRKCRYPSENPSETYPFYSYSACVVDCVIRDQLRLCGCLHYYLPHKGSDTSNITCDLDGLRCIAKHAESLKSIKSPKDHQDKNGMDCDCLSSCTEPEYQIINYIIKPSEEPITEVTLKMNALPTQRFIRNVVRTKLDLVVSMGGAAGLFLGASILSIVEFIYYCCIRKKVNDELNADKNNDIIKELITPNEGSKQLFQKAAMPVFYPRDYLHVYNAHL